MDTALNSTCKWWPPSRHLLARMDTALNMQVVTSFKASSWEDGHKAQHASGDLLQGIFLRGWTQRSTCKEPCCIVHFHLIKTFWKNWPCLITIKHVWTNVGRDSGYWAVQLQVQGWVLGYLNLRLRNLLTFDLDPDHEIVSCSNWNSNLDQPVTLSKHVQILY
jgi:hypothetical protein